MAETETETAFGYDLAQESINLFLQHEIHTNEVIDKKNKEVNRLVTKMEDLERFLTLVANRTDDSNRVDLVDAGDQAIVDKLREDPELQHIFDRSNPKKPYSWKDKELENLQRMINQHVEGPLQREIKMHSEQIVLDQHELGKALEIFKSGMNRMINLIERIMSNIQRAH